MCSVCFLFLSFQLCLSQVSQQAYIASLLKIRSAEWACIKRAASLKINTGSELCASTQLAKQWQQVVMCSGAPALSGFVMVLMKANPIDVKGEKMCACVLYFHIYKYFILFYLFFFPPQPSRTTGWGLTEGPAESVASRLMSKGTSIVLLPTFINPTGGRLRADSTFFLPLL